MAKLIIIVVILGLSACGTPKMNIPVQDISIQYNKIPQTYIAKKNDNLFLVAKKYNLDYHQLGVINKLSPPYKLWTGQKVKLIASINKPKTTNNTSPKDLTSEFITSTITKLPKAITKKVITKLVKPAKMVETKVTSNIASKTRTVYQIKWQWPVKGKVSKKFSQFNKGYQGIDINTKINTPIYAAADGIISYAGNDALDKYGLLIIINHNDEALSAYAHAQKLLVTEGEEVYRGQLIAMSGKTGSKIAKLHFEIRKDGFAKDPQSILP